MEPAVLIIPAYNEAGSLRDVLARVAEADSGCEVVVVDDGSHDGTGDIAARAGATVLRHPFNLGYGAALQTGYKYALERNATLVVQMDADGQHDPAQIGELAARVRSGDYDLVVGSRFLETTGYKMGLLRSIGRKVFSALARLADLRVSDPTSGFQCMNRRVLDLYARDFLCQVLDFYPVARETHRVVETDHDEEDLAEEEDQRARRPRADRPR